MLTGSFDDKTERGADQYTWNYTHRARFLTPSEPVRKGWVPPPPPGWVSGLSRRVPLRWGWGVGGWVLRGAKLRSLALHVGFWQRAICKSADANADYYISHRYDGKRSRSCAGSTSSVRTNSCCDVQKVAIQQKASKPTAAPHARAHKPSPYSSAGSAARGGSASGWCGASPPNALRKAARTTSSTLAPSAAKAAAARTRASASSLSPGVARPGSACGTNVADLGGGATAPLTATLPPVGAAAAAEARLAAVLVPAAARAAPVSTRMPG